jgi:hypothetical protein
MHLALEIPELVEQILGDLDGYDHGRCASVCKAWSEIALDYLWYHVGHHFGVEKDDRPGFVDLARLIAPVKTVISEGPDTYVCVLFQNARYAFLSATFHRASSRVPEWRL